MKSFTIKLLLASFCLLLLVLTIRGLPGNPDAPQFKDNLDVATKPFELSPERGRYAHIYNLAEYKHYDLTPEWAEVVYPDVGFRDGKFYSYFAPGISYLATPFYLLGQTVDLAQVFTFGFVALCTVVSLLFLYQISHKIFELPKSLSIFVALVFAFGTTSWSYAITLYQHHIFTLLFLSAFYAVWKYKNAQKYSWVWGLLVWFNYGIAISIDYPNALFMLPVIVYFLIASLQIKRLDEKFTLGIKPMIIPTAAIFILVIALNGYHNAQNFGSWKSLSSTLVGYKDIKEQNLLELENPDEAIAKLQSEKTGSEFFTEERFFNGFYTLLFSPDRGLFIYSPILLLALWGFYLVRKSLNLEHWILLSLVMLSLLLYSSWGDPWGGWAYGPRYLIPSMAVLSIFVGLFLHLFKYQITGRILALLLFAYSSAVAVLGALTTNAVPPKIEADYLGMKYNFAYNWVYLKANQSGSFIYNTYLEDKITLLTYGGVLLGALLLTAIVILFVLPRFEKSAAVPPLE